MTPNLDFAILSLNDSRYLAVVDLSDWGYLKDAPKTITLIAPGFNEGKTLYFGGGKINIFNSALLELSCDGFGCIDSELLPLPDGLWTIKICSGSESKEKKHLRIEGLYNSLITAYADGVVGKKNVFDMFSKLELAKGLVLNGYVSEGVLTFESVVDTAKQFIDCIGCNG